MTALCLLLGLCLLSAGTAAASYELVGSFGEHSTPVVEEPSGIAVNYTGAGNVPAGTIYVVNKSQDDGGDGAVVLSYSAQGAFRQAWGWGVANGATEFERCGPSGEAAHPTCPVTQMGKEVGYAGEGVGQIMAPEGVAVDQSTGDVYVFNGRRKKGAVQIFTAGGEPVGGFGENDLSSSEPSIVASPEKFHHTATYNRIAVDNAGTVYVADEANRTGASESRVMVFKPETPGDYEDYVYTGHVNDIGFSASPLYTVGWVATDDSGDVYVANKEFVYEFLAGETLAPACKYKLPGAQLAGMTVDPTTGEVFVISYSDLKIRQLAACSAQSEWKFVEKSSFSTQVRIVNFALAFDPVLSYGSSRTAGILYFGASPAGTENEWNIGAYAPAEVHSPRIEAESVSSIGTTSAALHAQIDPDGSQTRYAFQYLTNAAYEANEPSDRFAGALEAPVGGAVLGSGQKALTASASVAGLQPDTAYRVRVVASSFCNPEEEGVPCDAAGIAERFRTYPIESSTLPDGRAYEQVSPVDKAGGEVFQLNPGFGCVACNQEEANPFPKQASTDGEAVVFEGTAFSTSGGGSRENEYRAHRTSSGWQTVNLTPDRLETEQSEAGFRAFDSSLEHGLLSTVEPSLTPDAPSEYANLYGFSSDDPGALSPLLLQEPPGRSTGVTAESLKVTYAGASADLSHVLLEANTAYTSATPYAPAAVDGGPKANNLYEHVDGGLRLVNVLPGNTETVPGATFGAGNLYHPLPADGPHNEYAFDHAISDDGSRIFWSDASGQVYVRENGEVTREIPDHTGKYLTAAADGSEVLLSDGVVYGLEAGTKTDLTEGKGGFDGIVGQSDDLSSIYFVDTATLGSENERGEIARQGAFNLYLYRKGAITYIATLDAKDDNVNPPALNIVGDWHQAAGYRSAEASPDGRYLAFTSDAQLTGVDSTGPCFVSSSDVIETVPCDEVFVYDSQTGRLACASCNPTERPPLGNSALPVGFATTSTTFRLPQRYLTDSGRLYFDSVDSLSPFDTNGRYEDVYQYEPDGIGSCERSGGCVKLLSGGSEPNDSTFLDTDESGANVFFTTRDRLVPKDRDDLIDLYDARENGGFAGEAESAGAGCRGEACQPVLTMSGGPTPASSTFEGPGNLVPPAPMAGVKPKSKTLTRAERLSAALKTCRRKSQRRRRLACEKTARKDYAPKRTGKAKQTTRTGGR